PHPRRSPRFPCSVAGRDRSGTRGCFRGSVWPLPAEYSRGLARSSTSYCSPAPAREPILESKVKTMSEIKPVFLPERQRFALDDEGKIIGAAHFHDFDGAAGTERIFFHTTVDEEYGGQGLAGIMVKF